MKIRKVNGTWRRLASITLACSIALPAYAEGGFFPSYKAMFLLLMLFTMGFAIVITGVVYLAIKLLRPQLRLRIGRVFAVALGTWIAGLMVYSTGVFTPYLQDSQAIVLGLVLVFGVVAIVGLRTATSTRL